MSVVLDPREAARIQSLRDAARLLRSAAKFTEKAATPPTGSTWSRTQLRQARHNLNAAESRLRDIEADFGMKEVGK